MCSEKYWLSSLNSFILSNRSEQNSLKSVYFPVFPLQPKSSWIINMEATITINTANPKQPTIHHGKTVIHLMLLARPASIAGLNNITIRNLPFYSLMLTQVHISNINLSKVIVFVKSCICIIIQLFCLMRCIIH